MSPAQLEPRIVQVVVYGHLAGSRRMLVIFSFKVVVGGKDVIQIVFLNFYIVFPLGSENNLFFISTCLHSVSTFLV